MAHWHMCIKKTVMSNRLGYPVFRWVYLPPFYSGGEILANISEVQLIVKKYNRKGQPGKWYFSSTDGVISKINEFGWPRPPYVEEIFKEMTTLRENFPTENSESRRLIIPNTREAKKILIELQETWQSIKEGVSSTARF